ncbi:Similar to Demethylmenaquinone methyltransferase; acc. no. Q9RRT0 [Pyronema omphalodes CBS 100304]|uniref:Similar to Demethylmenaquinone methyltransferase acc. no. Q9RRT0 n=1 Tax=Pyronema omphalodes (strain CBS 100304) TaxID=1076935 RepID=U4KVF2_PYROM|nr:Similar to Demethylmenaquinone methyltransferase; acc. no. Q9RRT0 [Pyronema omphalodes CBS 100304]
MLEVDPTVLENSDEDYPSSGYDTSTASLTSSINQYIFENGRRYHAYYGTDKYLQPTDEKEQDRLDLQHENMRLAWKEKLYEAPLEDPQRILDIGTGTGIWAIEMADKFPMAEVIGTDLSPIQPSWMPTNCRFEVDDATLDWTFKSDFFDFIHARNISTGVNSWEHLTSEMMRCTTPGGYVELRELNIDIFCDDGSMKPDNALKVWTDLMRESLIKMGFEDVTVLKAMEPVGPWAKDPTMKRLGAMVLLNMESAFESYGMAAFTRVLDMDVDKARGLCEAARRASRNKNYHTYTYYYRAYGRKPMIEKQ